MYNEMFKTINAIAVFCLLVVIGSCTPKGVITGDDLKNEIIKALYDNFIATTHNDENKLVCFFIEKDDSMEIARAYIISNQIDDSQWISCQEEFKNVMDGNKEDWYKSYSPVLIYDNGYHVSIAAFSLSTNINLIRLYVHIINQDGIGIPIELKIDDKPMQYFLIKCKRKKAKITKINEHERILQIKRATAYADLMADSGQLGFIKGSYDSGIFYSPIIDPNYKAPYDRGLLAMDNGNYDEAEEMFRRIINSMIDSIYGKDSLLYRPPENDDPWSSSYLREVYFSYYNLACIYSITGHFDKCLYFLKEAIELGYPYLNHILSDPDMENFFNQDNREEIIDMVQEWFNNGNTGALFWGKEFEYQDGPSDFIQYTFFDDNTVKKKYPTQRERPFWHIGTYTIKNYIITMHFNKEQGNRVIGEPFIYEDWTVFYEQSEYYEQDMNETEIMMWSILNKLNDDLMGRRKNNTLRVEF